MKWKKNITDHRQAKTSLITLVW